MVAANFQRTHSPSQLARLAAIRCSVYIYQMNRVNSRNGHDDSTINIVTVIIIIIIIIIIF